MANEFKVKNGVIAPVVTTPSITSENNANIAIAPNGSGKVVLSGSSWPTTTGTTGYVLQTDGAGNLTWAAQTGGGGGGGSLTGSVVLNAYTGTGSQTAFVLSTAPSAIAYTTVNINGVTQLRTTAYTLSGSTITFTEAPALGAQIEVITLVTKAATAGTATINFGTGVGSNEASVQVTGQTTITATNTVVVDIDPDGSTATHSASDHRYFPELASLIPSAPTAGTGFTIYARSIHKLTGSWTVRWSWS
jgi:hypothetical protein